MRYRMFHLTVRHSLYFIINLPPPPLTTPLNPNLGRLSMSGGKSPSYAQNPISGERGKTLSITPHLPPHPYIIICRPRLHHSSHQFSKVFLLYYNVT